MDENQIGRKVVDCAVKLHIATGPGLFESVYETLLSKILEKEGLKAERQVVIPIKFDGQVLVQGFRADLVVEKKVILELKSVEKVCPAHKKQLITYLRLSSLKLGFLLNFGAPTMKEGITRIINGTL